MKNKKEAAYWIHHLKLSKHPEGGYFTEVYRSDETISHDALPQRFSDSRCFSTSIYYLLRSNEFSAFHRIKSDEIWHFYDGAPIILHILKPNGDYQKVILGRDAEKGEHLQYCIRNAYWFAAEVCAPDSYSLTGCTVAPGFDFADFEMGERNLLLQLFPNHTEVIERFTHSF